MRVVLSGDVGGNYPRLRRFEHCGLRRVGTCLGMDIVYSVKNVTRINAEKWGFSQSSQTDCACGLLLIQLAGHLVQHIEETVNILLKERDYLGQV